MTVLIPLPWRVQYYDIANDIEDYGWQQLMIQWYTLKRCFHLRIGLRWFPIETVSHERLRSDVTSIHS